MTRRHPYSDKSGNILQNAKQVKDREQVQVKTKRGMIASL